MGRPTQKGFLRLEGGSMGETTFSKKNGRYLAGEKIVTASKHLWKYDPRFARRREIANQFTTGVKAAKLIHDAVRAIVPRKDMTIGNRLRKLMISVVYMDSVSKPGEFKIQPDNLSAVTGFNFNKSISLRSVFNTRYTTSINRETGELLIHIPSFIPADTIKVPKGATHFKISAAGFAFDFENKIIEGKWVTSENMLWNEADTGEIIIPFNISANSVHPVMLFLGVEFVQEFAGVTNSVGHHKLDPLCIVEVSI